MTSVFPQIEGVIAKISKSSALYSLLVALIFSVAIVGIVFWGSDNTWLRFFSLLLPTLILYRIDRSYLFFSKNNPDMLRSETHVIQKQALALIGDETHNFGTRAADVIAVLNPNKPIEEGDVVELPPISDAQPDVPQKLS